MKQEHSPQFLRKRKFYMVLPVLVLPFLTLLFWAMGGGKGSDVNAMASVKTGINKELPSPNFRDDKLDKMSSYDLADAGKVKQGNNGGMDLQFQLDADQLPETDSGLDANNALRPYATGGSSVRANEEQVYQKLAQLNTALAANGKGSQPAAASGQRSASRNASIDTRDVDRLESMMQMMGTSDAEDPEMKQLDGMLTKIMDIQNPERVREQLRQASAEKRGQVFAVTSARQHDAVTLLDDAGGGERASSKNGTGFFSFEDTAPTADSQNAILATVHETQVLMNGSTVKLRLLNDVFINGVLIPKEQFIYGTARLEGERLGITISSMKYRNSLFPVDLSVYDLDGLSGIHIPDAISRTVAKNSADQGLQNIGLTTMDPSLGMQAASVGIEAARTFIGKKVKLIRVTVKAGYQVLLRDEKQKQ